MCLRCSGFSLTEVKACAINRNKIKKRQECARLFHNREAATALQTGGSGGAQALRAPLLSGSVCASPANTCSNTKSRRFRADARRSPSVPLWAAAGEKRACFFFFSSWNGGNEIRVPTQLPSLIHRLMAGGGGSPLLVLGCLRAAQNTITKVPETHRQPQLWPKSTKFAHMHVKKWITIKK